MDSGKISAAQLACMLFLSIIATSMLTSPSLAYGIAKNDMWMTPLVASLGGFFTVAISIALHRRYPGCTIVQYSDLILTKWLGKPVSFIFLVVCLQLNANQLFQFAELMKLSFMENTPIIVFSVSMMLVGAVTVNLGIELIGRLSRLFTPVIVILVIGLILPLVRDLELDQLLPLMERGPAPIFRGALTLQIWFPMYIYAAMFLPFVANLDKARYWLNWGVCWSTAIFVLAFIFILLSMGTATNLFSYPFLLLSRYVNISSFMTHLDALIMILWVVDVFTRTIVMYYAAVIGIAQWFRLPSYKPLTLPVGLIIVLLTFWSIPNLAAYNALGYIVVFYYSVAHLCIPLLLYTVSLLRGKPAAASQPPASPEQPKFAQGKSG